MNFAPATVVHVTPKTPSSVHLEIHPDPERLKQYSLPGQYAIIRWPGFKDGFFALSNPPGGKTFSFLVKKSSPLSEKLAGLKKGSEILLSEIQGKGFAMHLVGGRPVILLAVGSAIGPIRAALLYLLGQPGKVKSVSLFYGAINPGEFAYEEEFTDWGKKGVSIVQTVYPPDPSWKGLSGFVQDHLPKKLAPDSVALICGMQEMLTASRARLKEGGLSDDLILVNV